MTDHHIEHEQAGAAGRYVIRLADGSEAELTYRRRADGALVADHTFVPPQHRTAGLALKLVERLIEDARLAGERIVPLCSYVAAQFRRHPDWEPLRAG